MKEFWVRVAEKAFDKTLTVVCVYAVFKSLGIIG